jgi:arginine N-succinyltransferase
MTSHVLRPAREDDLADLQRLAATVEGGMTTLPDDPEVLRHRIDDSLRAFHPRIRKPGDEHYLFALEDVATGRVVGTSGIIACVGGFEPFWSYEIRREAFSHTPLGISKEVRVLHLKRSHRGPSEVCSLLLDPASRAAGLGRLLSLARFVFMATFPARFERDAIAELRGWLDDTGRSPFWESVGRHFFEHDYSTADFLSGLGNKAFIEDLMPKYPIYLSLLPPSVQAVIGRVHRHTEPALRMLLQEGFAHTDEVDIFDAGPIVRASLATLDVVRRTRVCRVETMDDATTPSDFAPPDHLVTNRALDFRACLARIHDVDTPSIRLPLSTAVALRVVPGDEISLTPLRPAKP